MNIEIIYDLYLKQPRVSTDTRKIEGGDLFFALKGPSFDGNQFAEKALSMGAAYAVVDDASVVKGERYLLVNDVLTCLQDLARHHRRKLGIPVLAITGSNGKTTTKELVNAVMSKKYVTYATVGNLNNHIGIPLTILSIKADVEFAIIEMGANHQKEIEGYCSIAEPNYGLINNVGKAHLEGFGGFEGVKKGKGELYDYLLKTNGTVFINSTNADLMSMSRIPNPVLYGGPNDFYYAAFVKSDPFITIETEDGEKVETKLVGAYNFDNILAALCIGKHFGVPAVAANRAVASYDPKNNRSQIMKTERNEIIMDAYNANPTSMRAAIENFFNIPGKNKVMILGDMFELGEESDAEHRNIGRLLSTSIDTKIFLVGKHMKAAAQQGAAMPHFETKTELAAFLQKNPIKESKILLKGSRGMGLESLVELL